MIKHCRGPAAPQVGAAAAAAAATAPAAAAAADQTKHVSRRRLPASLGLDLAKASCAAARPQGAAGGRSARLAALPLPSSTQPS